MGYLFVEMKIGCQTLHICMCGGTRKDIAPLKLLTNVWRTFPPRLFLTPKGSKLMQNGIVNLQSVDSVAI